MTYSALIVDDHPLYRDAMAMMVGSLLPNEVVQAAESLEDALRLCEAGLSPRLIMLDFGLRGLSGAAAVAEMSRRFPDALLLVISASEERQHASAALRAGALAFISKATPMDQMKSTILRALNGELRRPEWDQSGGAQGLSQEVLPDLSARQHDIVALLLRGYTNKEIALRLELAEITVKVHLTAIFKRLGVANRTQAVMTLQSLGIATARAGPGA